MIKKEMYICEECGEAFSNEDSALRCEELHEKEKLANRLLRDGNTLSQIKEACGFYWNLRDDIKDVTKDSCFVLSWWQCCDKPAYRITHIEKYGRLHLDGKGSWSGYYGGYVDLDKLHSPHPKEELFVDPR